MCDTAHMGKHTLPYIPYTGLSAQTKPSNLFCAYLPLKQTESVHLTPPTMAGDTAFEPLDMRSGIDSALARMVAVFG